MRNVLNLTTVKHTLAGSSILYRTTAVASLALAFAANDAQANPTGGQVVSGNVTITNPTSTQEVITSTSNKSIINWQNFDIMQGESTRFIQPGVNSISLNRVVAGQNASQILGTLTSNGKIVLVNPNGVFFGKGSKVDVAGMIASTADISNKNFLAGKMIFDQAGKSDASIINEGSITAANGGLVALVAPGVENNGTISANAGTIELASGSTVTVDMYGDNLYSFAVGQTGGAGVDAKGNKLTNGVSNTGVLSATGGTINLTANVAKNIVTNVVNNTGIIEASAAHVSGGTVVIDGGSEGNVNVAGTINVSGKAAGQTGGSVTVTGENIKVAKAKIDASGAVAGGSVKIGGDFHGAGALAHASTVSVDKDSLIDVSAIDAGNAGSAVIWSDKSTDFTGTLLGSGGAAGGNGGSAEISSAGDLNFGGTVDLHGVNSGTNGTLLLDPANITIDAFSAFAIDTALNLNSNVDIETSALPGSQAGNITVNSALSWFGNGALKLGANNNITVNKNITSTTNSTGNDGSITLAAGGDIALNNARLSTKSGDINFSGKKVSLTNSVIAGISGNINIDGSDVFSDTTTGNVHTATGNINIDQNAGGTIQTAIDAISYYANAQVTLGAGTYNEQVKINNKSNFTLTSADAANQATITAPAVMTTDFNTSTGDGGAIKSIVGVSNGDNVTVSNLRINGLSEGDANYRLTGISYDNAGGRVTNTIIKNIDSNPANGNQGGYGIYANSDNSTSHTLEIDHNTINRFQKNGIVVNGAGLTANVHDNSIQGLGAIDFIAQNGIVFSGGAKGSITNNTLSNIGYTPDSNEAADILLFGAGDNVEISGNQIDGAGYAAGIYDYNSNNAYIHDNTIGNVQDGVVVDSASGGALVMFNHITNATNAGVAVYDSATDSADYNDITNAKTGVLVDSSYAFAVTGNTITGGKTGIEIDNSQSEIVAGNLVHDVTGNGIVYTNTNGQPDDFGNRIIANTVYNTGANGIQVTDSDYVSVTGNLVGYTDSYLSFEGTAGAAGNIHGDGIQLNHSNNSAVYANYVTQTTSTGTNIGSGVYVLNSHDDTVGGATAAEGNHVTNVAWDDVKLGNDTNITVSHNDLTNAKRVGVYGFLVNDLNIDNNTISGTDSTLWHIGGISIATSNDVNINHNTVSNVKTGSGIQVMNLGGTNTVDSNTVSNVQTVGIDALNVAGLTVSNNTVSNAKTNGIHVSASNGALISGNVVHDTGSHGISIDTSDAVNVLGNYVGYTNTLGSVGAAGNINGDGILLTNSNGSTVAANYVTQTKSPTTDVGSGIHIVSSHDDTIGGATAADGNHVTNVAWDDIKTGDDVNLLISNNVLSNAVRVGVYAGNDSSTTISNNTITGTKLYGVGSIAVDNSADMTVTGNNVSFINSGDGIRFMNVTGTNLIDSNIVHGVGKNDIDIDGASNLTISNNTLYNGTNGININGATNVDINGNTIHDVTNDAILATNLTVDAGHVSNISGNLIYAIGVDGIHVDSVENANITGNHVFNLKGDAITGSNFTTVDGEAQGQNVIDNNFIYNIGKDGIALDQSANTSITNNTIFKITGNGIVASNLYRSGDSDGAVAGQSVIYNNTVYQVALDGINLDTVENAYVVGNHVNTIGHDGIHTSNLYVNGRSVIADTSEGGDSSEGGEERLIVVSGDEPMHSIIADNSVYNVGNDGIHLELTQNAQVTGNYSFHAGHDAIYASNAVADTTVKGGDDSSEGGEEPALRKLAVETLGTGSYDNALFDNNFVYGNGNDGIHLVSMNGATVSNNTSFANYSNSAVEIENSDSTITQGNTLANSANGLLLTNSTFATVSDNFLNYNGIGVSLTKGSDNASLSGDIFTGNTLGISLDNSSFADINNETLNIPDNGTGLLIANGSTSTTVEDTAFNNGAFAIIISGEGSDMSFGDDQSVFSNNGQYFFLQNGAMFGQTLDASKQTFDGTRGEDFTPAQLADAEDNHTFDVADDSSLGDVYYTAFSPVTPPVIAATFDQSVLDDFQTNKRNTYRRGNFSYAGRAINIVADPIYPGSLDLNNMGLSLLNKASPAAAVDIANAFATLAPAAGGTHAKGSNPTSPEQLAALAPAAGGPIAGPAGKVSANCGNNFLGDGYATGFSCSVQ